MRSPKFSTRRAARAQSRGNDAPSREEILRALDREGVPVTEDALEKALRAAPEHLQALRERLSRMERDGEILRNRRNAILITDRVDLLRGRVQGHPDFRRLRIGGWRPIGPGRTK
jgi:ribonuclease R